jgi:hypothetical protein
MCMITPDPMNIRNRIEKYTEDRDLQMLFKAVYLLGAMECEMLGKKYPSDKGEVYGPTGLTLGKSLCLYITCG